ncbi:LacI family DNA-binding transcriptional regulator [Curtobacterium ammoniigenes]|uniref:LacI family DNA-binding transcriptional regulator n=1 Tax=Curtobacterium ammoniigenes TaxID=395387 RepID=UPI00082B7953|nr:LacI family DNA-binding transcriptional regulator [Curtobacterium ammoniigenes]
MSRSATVVDVAAAAGVSRQTVSNVLNAPDVVAPATRERVERAIATLGYRPHASARRLRTRQSSTLGVRLDPVLNGISGAVLDRFLHALVESADGRGMRILLFTAADPADEIEQFGRLVDGSDVDGFVLTSTFHDDPRTSWLLEHDIPFVTFGRPWGLPDMESAPFPWVDVDGAAGLRDATRHLLQLDRHRIAFLGWPAPSGQGDERRRGWRDEMRVRLPASEADQLDLACEDDVTAAARTVSEAIARGRSFDAVVCASDTLAIGARIATGGSVPVVGYDNTPVAAALGLSSIEQPLIEAARSAIELLMGASGRSVLPPTAGHRLLAPRPVWRT